MDWKVIEEAYNMVKKGTVKRIDGEDFSLYKMGSIIRIDVKQEEKDG